MTQTFQYDGVNRIKSVTESNGGQGSQAFGYDQFGNRLLTSGYNPYGGATPTTQVFVNNRVSGWAYDSAGNLTTPSGVVSTATAT